jgi:hypothetical protein
MFLLLAGARSACRANEIISSRVLESSTQLCIQHCQFFDLTFAGNGGGIYVALGATTATIAYINGSTFLRCVATGSESYGGAVCLLGQSLQCFGDCFSSCFSQSTGQAIGFAIGEDTNEYSSGSHSLSETALALCGQRTGSTTLGETGTIWRVGCGLKTSMTNFSACKVSGHGAAVGIENFRGSQTSDQLKANVTFTVCLGCSGTSIIRLFLTADVVSYSNFISNTVTGYGAALVSAPGNTVQIMCCAFQGNSGTTVALVTPTVCALTQLTSRWNVILPDAVCGAVPTDTATISGSPTKSQSPTCSTTFPRSPSASRSHTPHPSHSPTSTPLATATNEFTAYIFPRSQSIVRFGIFQWFLEAQIWDT